MHFHFITKLQGITLAQMGLFPMEYVNWL